MSNQEQNTSNNPPIVEHTISLLNNPRQEQVKTKYISTSISDSQETSTNYHTNIFRKCPISNKISISETKTFAQLLDEFVCVNKTLRKRKFVQHAAIVTSSPNRALLEDSKTKKKCNTKTSTSLRNTQKKKKIYN